MKIELEIQYKGKTYKQPDCRVKLTPDGTAMYLILEKGKWKTIRSKDVSVVKWEVHDEDILRGFMIDPRILMKDDISKHVTIGSSTSEIFMEANYELTKKIVN